MALDTHILLSDDLNEFERAYIAPMRNKRDRLWEDMKGSETPEAQLEYDHLNSKVHFLEGMTENVRNVIRQDAVIVEFSQQFLSAWEEQKPSGISKAIKVLKEVVL